MPEKININFDESPNTYRMWTTKTNVLKRISLSPLQANDLFSKFDTIYLRSDNKKYVFKNVRKQKDGKKGVFREPNSL
jgi:hypothetical protein